MESKFVISEIRFTDFLEPDLENDIAIGGSKKCFKNGGLFGERSQVFKCAKEKKDDSEVTYPLS
jgi:hypothetical protein